MTPPPNAGRLLWATALAVAVASAPYGRAQAINEGFDTVANLAGQGWALILRTPLPNPGGAWRQGSDTDGGNAGDAFPPQAGPPGSYIRSDYSQSTDMANPVTISDWLILPTRTLNNGDTLRFFTRTNDINDFPERLQVRLSTSGASTDVGPDQNSVGVFTNLLLDINAAQLAGPANFPTTFTQFTVTVSGLSGPTSGRFALRHFLTNGGPAGANGDELGVDTLSYTPVPEPTSMALCGLAAVAYGVHRLRRKV